VQGEERDPQRFWLSVLGALRETTAGSKLVRPLMDAQGRRQLLAVFGPKKMGIGSG
jgi:hypothetical protein